MPEPVQEMRLEHKRSLRIETALKSLGYKVGDLIEMIWHIDMRIFCPDNLICLYNTLPTEAEVKLFNSSTQKPADDAEKYIIALQKYPGIDKRLFATRVL